MSDNIRLTPEEMKRELGIDEKSAIYQYSHGQSDFNVVIKAQLLKYKYIYLIPMRDKLQIELPELDFEEAYVCSEKIRLLNKQISDIEAALKEATNGT